MRVTIEHREETAGLSGNQRRQFVDCSVEFSQEELAIIKARGLADHSFTLPAAVPPPSAVGMVGVGALRTLGRLLIVGGVVFGIVSGFAGWHGDGLSFLILIIGIGLEIYGWRQMRAQDRRIEEPDQTVTLRQLISTGRFTVYAPDPARAKTIDDDIRAALAAAKHVIQESAEIGSKQTFEL